MNDPGRNDLLHDWIVGAATVLLSAVAFLAVIGVLTWLALLVTSHE